MSGILDPKSRIMDVLLTEEGRRQVADGSIRIVYASFSDATTFYENDIISGSSDTSNRLFLECSSSPYDQITFEVDDGGHLSPLKNTSIRATNGFIFSGSNQFVTGSGFVDSANLLLSSSLDAFRRNYLIGTIDTLFEHEEFGTGRPFVKFQITEKNPIESSTAHTANVTTLESLIQDEKMVHLPNFMYLPPINKPTDSSTVDFNSKDFMDQHVLANYARLDSAMPQAEVERRLKDRLELIEARGNVKEIAFDPTSTNNSLHSQLFEIADNRIRKLDIVDFGKVQIKGDGTVQRVFFAGKVFMDDFGTHTFVNMFTLVFE